MKYIAFNHKGTSYVLPTEQTGTFSDGSPRYDSGIDSLWIYHLEFHEWFTIILNGFCLNSSQVM